ncbi:MAG: HD domain-containing protein [Nanoarchaeota archaeon]|nr:HD domain-containing protein [Nanoarchaeota archaeon]
MDDFDKFLSRLDWEHKHNIWKILNDDERELLRKLAKHHSDSVVHSFNVATDCVFVAKKLRLTSEEIKNIRIAALLHDVGKVYMDAIVLDEGVDEDEQKAILGRKYVEDADNLVKIKIIDLIKYRARGILGPKHISWKKESKLLKALGDQAYVSIREHINNHQHYTAELLEKAGTPDKIIAIAVNHHPEYPENPHREYLKKYPSKKEIRIISAVDKFNAMIQSEGKREYTESKTRSEALLTLIDKIKERKEILGPLGEKYLPGEAKVLNRAASDTITERYGKAGKEFLGRLIERIFSWLSAVRKLKLDLRTETLRNDLNQLELAYENYGKIR